MEELYADVVTSYIGEQDMGNIRKMPLAPLRALEYSPVADEGHTASIIFTSPHSKLLVHFEWRRGCLWFKRNEQIYGHWKQVDGEEWKRAKSKLAELCRIETGAAPAKKVLV